VHERYRQMTDRWQTDGRQHIANVNSSFTKNGWTNGDAICVWTPMGRKKHLLHDGAHWCNLANITEPSVCGGDMALCHKYFDHLFWVEGQGFWSGVKEGWRLERGFLSAMERDKKFESFWSVFVQQQLSILKSLNIMHYYDMNWKLQYISAEFSIQIAGCKRTCICIPYY